MTHVNVHGAIQDRTLKIFKSRNMKLKELSFRSGFSMGWLSDIMSGRNVNPRVGSVWALAGAMLVRTDLS